MKAWKCCTNSGRQAGLPVSKLDVPGVEEHSSIEAGECKHGIFGEWNEIRLESQVEAGVKDYPAELGAFDYLPWSE